MTEGCCGGQENSGRGLLTDGEEGAGVASMLVEEKRRASVASTSVKEKRRA